MTLKLPFVVHSPSKLRCGLRNSGSRRFASPGYARLGAALAFSLLAYASVATALAQVQGDQPPESTTVFVEVRGIGGDSSKGPAIIEQPIRVPDTNWVCKYTKPFSIKHLEPPQQRKHHFVECANGPASAGVGLECPVETADLRTEILKRGGTRLAETLVLVEQAQGRETRRFVTIGCEPPAHASVWYAQPSQDGQHIARCIEWPMSIDAARETIEKKFGACTLAKGQSKEPDNDGSSAMGFFFECGPKRDSFVFARSSANCDLLSDKLAEGHQKSKPESQPEGGDEIIRAALALEDFAPQVVKSRPCKEPISSLRCPRASWEVAFTTCFTSGSAFALDHRQLQPLADFCSCMGEIASRWPDRDLPEHAGEMAPEFRKCFRSAYGSAIPEDLLAKMLSAFKPRPANR